MTTTNLELDIVLRAEPVYTTLMVKDSMGRKPVAKRKLSLAVAATSTGYIIVGIDIEDESIVCTSSTDDAFRLTPLEAIQLLRTIDGLSTLTLTGPYEDEVEEFNLLIKVLRGSSIGHEFTRVADMLDEPVEKLLEILNAIPEDNETPYLMHIFSSDSGLGFFESAQRVVAPYMERRGLIGREELWWITRNAVPLSC